MLHIFHVTRVNHLTPFYGNRLVPVNMLLFYFNILPYCCPCIPHSIAGQNFTNLLTVSNLQATQNEVTVDTNGCLNMDIPINLVITVKSTYGYLTTPLMDIDVY